MSSLGRLLAGAGGLALLVSAWPAAADAAETGMPRQVVEQTVESVLGVLRQELPKEERRARLEEIVYDRFDFRTMSRLVLARNWKKLDGDQKEQFVTEYRTYLANSYGARLDRYSGEEVVVVGERQEPRGDVTVLTKVVGGEYDGSLVDYRMRSKNGGPWLVIDVIVEGVSLVSNYRDQFKEVLSNGGPEELLRRLKEKNAAGISDQVQGSRPGQGPDHPTSLASREGSPRGGSLHIGPYDLRPTGTDAASLRSVCG